MYALRALALVTILAAATAACATSKSSGRAPSPHIGRVRHVVLFKFKDGTSPEEIRRVEEAFAALPAQIPAIRDFEWGTDISPEGLQRGHTHAFLVTFDTPADRDAYLPHPAHQAFVTLLQPHLEKATVVDFVAKAAP